MTGSDPLFSDEELAEIRAQTAELIEKADLAQTVDEEQKSLIAEEIVESAYGRAALTPRHDIIRAIRFAPDKLLAVFDREGQWRLYADNGSGVWLNDNAALKEIFDNASTRWARGIPDSSIDVKAKMRAIKWAANMADGTKVQNRLDHTLGMAVREMIAGQWGGLPEGFTIAASESLDADHTCIGAPNGVIELTTGNLLTGDVAREKLVTRTVRDPYDPEARHDAIDHLTDHLEIDDERFLWNALGYALYRSPSRRFYYLVSDPGTGKTTLLKTIVGSLGDYGTTLKHAELTKEIQTTSAHTEGMIDLVQTCVALIEEPDDDKAGNRLNAGRVNEFTGGGFVSVRSIFGSQEMRVVTATLFGTANTDRIGTIHLETAGIADRAKLVPFRALPSIQATLIDDLTASVEARQAIIARLVLNATVTPRANGPPQPSPNSQAITKNRIEASIGQAGVWIRDNLTISRYDSDVVSTKDIWKELAYAFNDGITDTETIAGIKRDRLSSLVQRHHDGVGNTKQVRPGERGWRGMTITPAGTDEAYEEYLEAKDGQG